MPVVMEGRRVQKMVATFMPLNYDVNFGELTRSMFKYLDSLGGVTIHFHHEVKIKTMMIKLGELKLLIYLQAKKEKYIQILFIGAGGGYPY
jgi:malate dehydrogenase (quinone)